ncbi:MAG TPA: hypothetical protein VGW38_02570 [Chloroflexota bacterium]|nr:hypothetical protein [Chloroflexota bacterium]
MFENACPDDFARFLCYQTLTEMLLVIPQGIVVPHHLDAARVIRKILIVNRYPCLNVIIHVGSDLHAHGLHAPFR